MRLQLVVILYTIKAIAAAGPIPGPSDIIIGPAHSIGPLGGSVQLNCTFRPEYKGTTKGWLKNGVFVSIDHAKYHIRGNEEEGEYNLEIQSLTLSDSGEYTCFGTGADKRMARLLVASTPKCKRANRYSYYGYRYRSSGYVDFSCGTSFSGPWKPRITLTAGNSTVYRSQITSHYGKDTRYIRTRPGYKDWSTFRCLLEAFTEDIPNANYANIEATYSPINGSSNQTTSWEPVPGGTPDQWTCSIVTTRPKAVMHFSPYQISRYRPLRNTSILSNVFGEGMRIRCTPFNYPGLPTRTKFIGLPNYWGGDMTLRPWMSGTTLTCQATNAFGTGVVKLPQPITVYSINEWLKHLNSTPYAEYFVNYTNETTAGYPYKQTTHYVPWWIWNHRGSNGTWRPSLNLPEVTHETLTEEPQQRMAKGQRTSSGSYNIPLISVGACLAALLIILIVAVVIIFVRMSKLRGELQHPQHPQQTVNLLVPAGAESLLTPSKQGLLQLKMSSSADEENKA